MAAARSTRHVSARLPTAEHAGRRDASSRAPHAHPVRTRRHPGPAADPDSREGASMKRSMVRPTAGAAAVMLLALTAACSSSSSSSTASGGSTSTAGGSTSGKSYKMSFIQGVQGDGFYVTMGCGIQAEAKKIGSITVQRTQGFADAVKADPKFKYVGVQYNQDSASIAAQVTLAALQKNPGIVGIFATNLFGAEGAATGVRQAGKSGKVKIVGFDAGPDQITAVEQGTVQALIAQHPYDIGTNAVDQAYAALTGKQTDPKIGTKFTIITKANLNSADSQAAIYKTSC